MLPQHIASSAPTASPLTPLPRRILGYEPLTWAKIIPLGIMFFCILFNYTILRDTKDVLVVTAPGSGAEIIPFLKTYVNLPMAIGFTVLYAKVGAGRGSERPLELVQSCERAHRFSRAACLPCPRPLALPATDARATTLHPQLANVLSTEALFYTCIIPFIVFFGSFAGLLYPMRDVLHPTGEQLEHGWVHACVCVRVCGR